MKSKHEDMYNIVLYGLRISLSKSTIIIENSYNIELPEAMEELIQNLRMELANSRISITTPLNFRSNKSIVNEWLAFNNLYKIGCKPESYMNLKIDYPYKWYNRIIYWLFSRIVL